MSSHCTDVLRAIYTTNMCAGCVEGMSKRSDKGTEIFHFFDVSSAKDTGTGRTAASQKGNYHVNILQVFFLIMSALSKDFYSVLNLWKVIPKAVYATMKQCS